MKSLSDREMSEKSLMCLLIIDRQSRLEAQLFDASKYLVRSFRYKAATLYIYDLTKFSLFMKSDTPIRQYIQFLFAIAVHCLSCKGSLFTVSYVFAETKFYLIPISLFSR